MELPGSFRFPLLAHGCRNMVLHQVGSYLVNSGSGVNSFGKAACDPTVWTGRALQAESSEQWLVLRFCIRPLRGADRSWPSWISARVRSHSRIGPRRPVGSPDHERDGETVLPFFKSNSQTSAGISHFKRALGLTEAIPSEPPSLARPDGRATVAEKGGGHPFGEPERAHVIPLLR